MKNALESRYPSIVSTIIFHECFILNSIYLHIFGDSCGSFSKMKRARDIVERAPDCVTGDVVKEMARACRFSSVEALMKASSSAAGLKNSELNALSRQLTGRYVVYKHMTFCGGWIVGLGPASNHKDSTCTFDGKNMTVDEYFRDMCIQIPKQTVLPKGRLHYPMLPTLNIGSVELPVFIPPEIIVLCAPQEVVSEDEDTCEEDEELADDDRTSSATVSPSMQDHRVRRVPAMKYTQVKSPFFSVPIRLEPKSPSPCFVLSNKIISPDRSRSAFKLVGGAKLMIDGDE